ncbi:MAG: FGGY family carbohydrate kinase [[Eubacterium] siraeum]
MTHGKEFRCDYSNASRTQLFNIRTLSWDSEICSIFGIDPETLPTVTDSDGLYGYTDLDGYFSKNPDSRRSRRQSRRSLRAGLSDSWHD